MIDEKKMIGYADESSEEDMLGGNKYFEGLAHFITKCETPMTISIQGDWGTGKTTALNIIQKKLEEKGKNKYYVLWFRTWQYSKFGIKENITLALMSSLYQKLNQIAKEKNKMIEPKGKLAVKFFKEGLITATDSLVGGKAADKLEKVTNALLDIEDIVGVSEEIEQLKENIQKCINEIVSGEERLVIFVDDLDRLEPRVAIELLEGLKVFLDCKKCVYVLAIDSKVVHQGVEIKYGDKFGAEKSKKFFDKIIQVPFNLPVNQYDLQRYIGQFVNDKEYIDQYSSIVRKIMGTNPRSIKRAFNLLRLHELIMEDSLKNELDKINLFTILLLQMCNEELYSNLVNVAKDSSERVYEEIKKDEYATIREALDLYDNEMEDERWTDFVELLIGTSKIAINNAKEEKQIEYANNSTVEEILSRISDRFKKEQLNNSVINYLDKEDKKKCSFRLRGDAFNIVIYSTDTTPLDVLYPNDLLNKTLCNKNNTTITNNQLGFYQSSGYITFVDVQKCKNINLLENVMKFYGLFD